MKTREERMYEHLYSNEGRVEQCERICKLEKLARNLWECCTYVMEGGTVTREYGEALEEQMRELGIEVES